MDRGLTGFFIAKFMLCRFLLASYLPFIELAGNEASLGPLWEVADTEIGHPRQILAAILDMLISDLKNGGETAGILLEYFSDEEVISLLCHFGVIVCNSTLNRLSDHHDRPSVMLTPTHPKSQLLLQCSSLTK